MNGCRALMRSPVEYQQHKPSHKAIKKVVMKTQGERDYGAQETIHHLLSLKLHSSSFTVMPFRLNCSRRVQTNSSDTDSDTCTDNCLLDVYANRE